MFPTCLGCLRKLSGRPTASTARCACERTSRLRLVAGLLRTDRSDAVDPVVAHTHAAMAYTEKGRYAFVVIADCSTFFRHARGQCVAPALDNPAPRSDDRVLGWTPRRPRVLKHCASIRGGDCFRLERRTQSAGLASSAWVAATSLAGASVSRRWVFSGSFGLPVSARAGCRRRRWPWGTCRRRTLLRPRALEARHVHVAVGERRPACEVG